ncbi:MAG: amidohydrolase family protein [Erythrobacter sp.]|jgi:imidazolonepropionase-like amidohydrolase|nr:amidohydrolase family protein [Erythrobacter sp.]
MFIWLRTSPKMAIFWLGLSLIVGSGSASAAHSQPVALINANVLDEDFKGTTPNQTILIVDDRIVAVGMSGVVEVPQDARVVDLSGKTVIPGLWDAHVHTRYEGIDHLRLALIHGITTIRDLGGPWEHLHRLTQWRSEIDSGERLGPRIWTGGTVLNNPGANWAHITVVNTPEEGRQAVRRLRREGADFVKVYSQLTPDNYFAILDEADIQGLPVDGHLPYALSPEQAAEAGQRAIEHADNLAVGLSAGSPQTDADGRPVFANIVGKLDEKVIAQVAGVFIANETFLVPTLALPEHFVRLRTHQEDVRANPALRFIPRPYLSEWEASLPLTNLAEWQASALLAQQITISLHENGVPILAGTDVIKPFFVPGDALHQELASLVEAGLTEGEAIKAATLIPSQMMGVDDSGLIKAGYVADLVVLDQDPLSDIANSRKIAAVMRAGRLLDGANLDHMSDEIVAAAAQWNGLPSGRDR